MPHRFHELVYIVELCMDEWAMIWCSLSLWCFRQHSGVCGRFDAYNCWLPLYVTRRSVGDINSNCGKIHGEDDFPSAPIAFKWNRICKIHLCRIFFLSTFIQICAYSSESLPGKQLVIFQTAQFAYFATQIEFPVQRCIDW